MAKLNITTKVAIQEIRKLMIEVEELRKKVATTGNANAQSFNTITKALRDLKNSAHITANQINGLTDIIAKNKVAIASNKQAITSLTKENEKLTKQVDKLTKAKEKNAKSGKQLNSVFDDLFGGAKALIGAFGIVAGLELFGNIIKDAFKLMKEMDSVRFAMEKIGGTALATASSFEFLNQITTDYGVELVTTANRWIKFLAAAKQSGLTLMETENIFRSMTKAAGVLGLKTDELTGVYLALEQMLSKGKVTTEELRRQLGERLPGAFGIMASSMGVTMEELDKLLKKGEVLSAEVLPDFAKAVELSFGIESTEKVDTLIAAQERLTNAWTKFVLAITEGSSALKNFMNDLSMFYEFYIRAFGAEAQKRELLVVERAKIFAKNLLKAKKAEYNEQLELGNKMWNIEKDMLDAKEAVIKNKGTKNWAIKEKALLKEVDRTTKIYTDHMLNIEKLQKEHANNNIEEAKRNFEIYDKLREKQEAIIKEEEKGTTQFGLIKVTNKRLENARAILKANEQEIVNTRVIYQAYLKITETPDDDESGRGRRRRLNTVDTLALDLEIAKLEYIKSIKDEIAENDNLGDTERLLALKESIELEMKILDLQRQKKILKAEETSMQIEQLKGFIAEETNEKTRESMQEQLEWLTAENERTSNELLTIEQDYQTAYLALVKAGGEKSLKLIKEIDDKRKALKKENIEEWEQIFDIKETEALIDLNSQGITDLEDYEKKKDKIVYQHALNRLNILIELAKKEADLYNPNSKLGMEATKNLRSLELAKADLTRNYGIKTLSVKQEQFIKDIEMAQKFASEMVSIINSIYESRIQSIEREIQVVEDNYEREKVLRDDNKEQNKIRDLQHEEEVKKLEAKKRKEQIKQAKLNKAANLFDIAMNTAVAYTKALAQGGFILGIPMGTVILALGALQAAAVLAQPIPKFKDGGRMGKDGLAIVGDGGQREVVQTSKGTYLTGDKPQLIGLQKGDKVYKNLADYQAQTMRDLQRASILTSLEADRKGLQGVDIARAFNKNFDNLEGKILNALSKARIQNTNNIKIDLEHLYYRNKTL